VSTFEGFPPRLAFTPVPNVFFSHLLPEIDDIDELKVTLQVIAGLYPKKGSPRFITRSELLANPAVVSGLQAAGSDVAAALDQALDKAVRRGTLLRLSQVVDEREEDVYLLNDDAGRRTVERIKNGEMSLGLKIKGILPASAEKPPDIFTAYEQNIGMLTPMIAEELRDAEQHYPAAWILDAIKEAVVHNKRNMRYIMKVLETWSVEGKSDGTYQRDSEKTDPDRYIKGKYGHMVRRR